MKSVPNGYLTLEKPVREPSRVMPAELTAGIVDWWARLWDLVLGSGADRLVWGLVAVVVWLVTLLFAYNTGLHTR